MCEHTFVTIGTLDGANIWTCTECAQQFVPVKKRPIAYIWSSGGENFTIHPADIVVVYEDTGESDE